LPIWAPLPREATTSALLASVCRSCRLGRRPAPCPAAGVRSYSTTLGGSFRIDPRLLSSSWTLWRCALLPVRKLLSALPAEPCPSSGFSNAALATRFTCLAASYDAVAMVDGDSIFPFVPLDSGTDPTWCICREGSRWCTPAESGLKLGAPWLALPRSSLAPACTMDDPEALARTAYATRSRTNRWEADDGLDMPMASSC